MQLVAYGAQDIYLTGNPQITFFKVVYRRHTNFSMESIQQTLNGLGTSTTADGTAIATISRNGDLVHKVYVAFPTSGAAAGLDGSQLVKEAELEIGGQKIDRHYQEWNEVWNELSTPESKAIGLKAMQFSIGENTGSTGVGEAHVPLNFWFCRNPGLALPLIALQYHEVKIKLMFGLGAISPKVWCDYIYLDTDERRRFAQVSHEYLIEQLQKEDKTSANTQNSHKLNFNHPVKELIWTTPANNTMSGIKLQLNGHDRFSEQPEEYFTLRQPFDYHTAVPRQNLPSAAQLTSNFVTRSNNLLTDSLTGEAVTVANPVVIPSATGFYYAAMSDVTQADAATTATAIDFPSVAVSLMAIIGRDAQIAEAFPTVGGAIGSLYELRFNGTTDNLIQNPIIVQASVSVDCAGSGGAAGDLQIGQSLVTFDRQIFNGAPTGAVLSEVRQLTLDTEIASQARTSRMARKIGVYSFALKPEEHQPSGTCNFSRIDNAQLIETSDVNDSSLTVYAVNYNVLRIMSGMGGLAYSN